MSDGYTSSENIQSTIFDDDENILILEDLLLQLLANRIKVYLDGIGIIYSQEKVENKTYSNKEETIFRKEHKNQILFEKSYELNKFHYDKFKNLMETKEIAIRLYPRLSFNINSKITTQGLMKEIKKFFEKVRAEVLLSGISNKLKKIGTFYALKHSKNKPWQENFANSDIILYPNKEEIIKISDQYNFPTPIFKSSWEPLESAFDKPLEIININIISELQKLGYQTKPILDEFSAENLNFPVAVFSYQSPKINDEEILIYCTNGIRKLTPENNLGNELTVQTTIAKGSSIPLWPLKIITFGWIMLNSSKEKELKRGTLINVDLKETLGLMANIEALITEDFRKLPNTYYCLEGEFKFINILGLTDNELEFVKSNSSNELLNLLSYKDHNQITKLLRRDIF